MPLAALWVIDFLFEAAREGASGVNLHAGAEWRGYTPLADNGARIVEVRPEYYGMYLFAMAARGGLVETTVSAGGLPFSAYAVAADDGSMAVVLVNRDRVRGAEVTLELGAPHREATITVLTGPSLESLGGARLLGAPIGADGAFAHAPPPALTVAGKTIVFQMDAASAALLSVR
jgi:hypothetical protein